MKCIVLAGGGGLRLWPLSRKGYPKQFLKLGGERTMFAESVYRNKIFCDDFILITNDSYRFIVENEINKLGLDKYEILLESVGRNTAPAIAIAAMLSDPDEILFVVPADAQIIGGKEYKRAVEMAEELAQEGNIVTFGIQPTFAHTGYGYIKYNGNDVLSFKEKPDQNTANEYFSSEDYLWNSGMFMFKSRVFLEELKKYGNTIFCSCQSLAAKIERNKIITIPKEYMLCIPSESVDYAVMEKSDKIKVVKSNFYWNDVGSFEAIFESVNNGKMQKVVSNENIIINNCTNVNIFNDATDKLVIANDLSDTIIINTNDAVYVTKYGSSSKIKNIIEQNKKTYGRYFDSTIKNYRPWGYYEVLINNPGYKVKKITLYPNKRLSLQKHFYRSEHWTIVDGIATITLGEKTKKYIENESAYIPIGQVHRLANETDSEISIIEVSIGERIDENDIVRLEDDFGR